MNMTHREMPNDSIMDDFDMFSSATCYKYKMLPNYKQLKVFLSCCTCVAAAVATAISAAAARAVHMKWMQIEFKIHLWQTLIIMCGAILHVLDYYQFGA